jgi:hypothetical protein
MGGLGSGPWKKSGRKTVDSCWALDANSLSVLGYLRPGWSGTYQLAAGTTIHAGAPSLHLRCEAEQLFLSYTPQGGEEVTRVVLVVRLPWRFGGSRPYSSAPEKVLRAAGDG